MDERGLHRNPLDQKPEDQVDDEDGMDFTMDELREFLEADHFEVAADPAFREGLREKLWEIVRTRAAAPRPDDDV